MCENLDCNFPSACLFQERNDDKNRIITITFMPTMSFCMRESLWNNGWGWMSGGNLSELHGLNDTQTHNSKQSHTLQTPLETTI